MVKNLPANSGDKSSIPGSGRSPGRGNSNPLQYSCLENSMGRGAWRATIHRTTKSQTQPRTHECTHTDTHTHKERERQRERNRRGAFNHMQKDQE